MNEFKVKKGLIVQGSGSTVLDIQGSQGQLFSVTDSLSGSLFSVNDISGIPILEVFSDNRINLGTFGAEAIKISGSTANITGSITNAISASFLSNGVVSGSSQITFSGISGIPSGLVSGSSQITLSSTNGYSTFSSSIATTTLNLSDRIGTLETSSIGLNTYTSSIKSALEFTGSNVTIKGNLMVKGSTTTVDSTTIEIGDNIISLNGTGATNAGIIVRDATAPNLISGSLLWDTTTDKWIAGPVGSEDEIILSTKTQTLTNKTINGTLNTITNIGNSSLTNSSITIAGTSVSLGGSISSSTILLGTNVWSGSVQLPSGLVSGSSQITISGTTGFGTYINQSLLTTSSPSFTNLTIGTNQVLHAGNYNNYVPTKTGTGASGTWGISITGSSTTATNLANGSAGTIPYQTSVGTTAMLAAGTSGYFLKSNNTSAPSWVELSLTDLPDAWVKKSVKVATTTNITLSGTTTIDGVVVVAGDRVLVKNQTTTSQNGIYIVNSSTWTRSTDADTISKLSGTVVNVDSGTSNGGLKFITKLKITDTLGSTAVNFYKVTDETDLSGYVTTSRTLTINGTTYNLSADRSWSVGTVTSVGMSVPTGFSIGGSPITTSGLLSLSFASGYSLPTTISQTNWDASYTHSQTTGNPHGTTKSDIGLGNVDNTSDLNKPISTAVQTALNSKQNTLTNPVTGTGTTNYLTKFSTNGTISDSQIFEDGTYVRIKKQLITGYGLSNVDNFISIANTGVGYATGFKFDKSSDGAGLSVTEVVSDSTMYEFFMSDNPEGGDMMQMRFTDWHSANTLTVPIWTSGKENRFIARQNYFYGSINQSTNGIFTTSNFGEQNGSQNQLQINQTSKLRIVGSSVNITDLNINDYTGGHNDPIWIKLDSATTFAWGIGSHTGTAVQSNIPLSTSATTLSNGIKVTFSATTGTVGDLFTFRAIGKPVNYFGTTNFDGNITATSFIKSGGNSSQFLMADGSVVNDTKYINTTGGNSVIPDWYIASPYVDGRFSFIGNYGYPALSWGQSTAYMSDEGRFYLDSAGFSQSDSGTSNYFSGEVYINNYLYVDKGLTINGSLNSGASNYAGYRQNGNNIILKGNSTGVSGIFFQSEKDGTNINHPSDYGYIQFHAYGIDGTSGESNKLVIGVANDSDDTVVLQSPYMNGVKISCINGTSGTGGTEYTVWHQGNHGAGSGLDADLLDGQDSSYFLNTSSTTQTKSGNLVLTGDLTVTGSIIIASTANPAQRNILVTDVNGYLSFQNLTYTNTIGSGNGNVNLTQNYPIVGNTTTSGYMFSGQANAVAGSQDVGIRRNNIGSIEIFNGITGDGSIDNRRDLILRNITGSNALFTGNMTSSGSTIVLGTLEVDTVNNGVGDFLTRTAGGIITRRTSSEVRSDIGAIGGTGTSNYLTKFTASGTISNSLVYDNGTNVGINTTSPSYKLDVNGTIRATQEITALDFIGTSDFNLKENIETYDEKPLNTEYRSFNFKNVDTPRIGLIAQELEQHHPEFVRIDESGTKSISYIDLHSAEIAYLKKYCARLEEELNELKNRI